MSNKSICTDAPREIEESLKRSVVVPNFELTPEGVAEFEASRKKRQISIFLNGRTIDRFKKAAEEKGSRYQTMISSVLDAYSSRYL
ncbi:hypothetical protein FWH30_02465 [Microgenomates group bacterium]|nr:hypothetical protein [Microgenomates group bacterium]